MPGSSSDHGTKREPIATALLFLLFGPLVWALHFLAVYGSQSMLCTVLQNQSPRDQAIDVTIWALTVCAGALVVWALMRPHHLADFLKTSLAGNPFHRATAYFLCLLSAFAIAASALGSLFVDNCDTLR